MPKKKRISPTYYDQVEIICACGQTVITGSTLPGPIKVQICYHCHPFWTGEKKLIDTEGQVQKFERRKGYAATVETQKKKTQEDKRNKKEKKQRILTLKELLEKSR